MELGKSGRQWLPGSDHQSRCEPHTSTSAAIEVEPGLQAQKEPAQDIFITITLGFSPNELFQENVSLTKHTASLNFHVIRCIAFGGTQGNK